MPGAGDERMRSFEVPLRALVGDRITRVHYFEIDYGDGQAHWFDDPRFDSLDLGLTLELDSGGRLAVTWGNEWACWGLSFNPDRLSLEGWRTADVSHESRWETLLGVPLSDVEMKWTLIGETDRSRAYYPTVARLGFKGGRSVYVCAFEIGGDRLAADDHITRGLRW